MGGSQSAQASNYMSLSENTQQSATNIATFNASASSNLVNVINVTDVTCAGNFTVSDISQCNYGSTTLTASNTVDNSNDLSSDLSQDMSQVATAQAMGTAFGDQSTTASSYMTASMSSSQTMLNESMTACTTETSEKNEININNINAGGDCDISDINQCNTNTDVNSCTADVTQSNTGSITMSQTASQEDTAKDVAAPMMAIFLLFIILVVVFCCCLGAVAKDVTQILLDTSTSFLPWFFMVIGLGCIGAGIYFVPFKYRQDKEAAANYAACGQPCEERMLGWTNVDASDVPNPNQFGYETNVCSAQGQLKCAGYSWPGTDGATRQYCSTDSDCPRVNTAQTVCSGGICTKACGANQDCFPDDTGNDKTTGGGVNAFNFCTAEKCAVGVCTGEGWVGGEMVFVSSSNDEYTVDVNAILNADDGSGSSGDGSGSSGDGSGSPVLDVSGTRRYVNGLPCSTPTDCVTYCTADNYCAHDPSIDCSSNADCSNAPGICSVASCVSSYGEGACPEPYVDVSGSGLYDASNGIFDRSLNQMCSTAGRLNCTSWTDPTSAGTSSSNQPKYEAYPALMYWGTRAAAPFSLMPRYLLQSATEGGYSEMGPTPAQYACGALLGGVMSSECLMEQSNDNGTVLEPAANSMALFWDSRRISFPVNWSTNDLTGNPSADAGGLSCLGSNVTKDTLLGPTGCGASSVADNVLISRGAGNNTGMCIAQSAEDFGCENSDNNTCKAGDGPKLRAVLTAWSFGGPIISGNCSVYTSMGTMDNNAFGRAAFFRPPFSDINTYVYGNGGFTKTNTRGQYASSEADGTGYQNELQRVVEEDGGEPQVIVDSSGDSSGGGCFVRHVCGGNSAATGSDFAGQTIYEPCVTPYPTGQIYMESPSDVPACLYAAQKWRTSRYEWILENAEDWDINLEGDGDDLDKALKADACPVDDLTMYLPRMINLPVTQKMHSKPNTLDGKYHTGFLHTRSTLRPTLPDAFTGTFAPQYMLDYQLGAELDVMWADEIIGNTVAYPGVSLRWCYAACAGASRWRDQIDNPSLEYELLVYRTGTVSEPTPKGLMQGQMLGNTVSTAISQTAYYLKDHIANADAIQGSGDGTCTGSLQSNGCGGYRGGQLCTHDDDDAASLTSSCFNVIMYVGPFAANNYIAPWLEDKERTKVSFTTYDTGNPSGLFAPRTEGECLAKDTGELLACQLDVNGHPMPYANSSDASGETTPNCVDFSGCAGDNITTVASALRRVGRNVDAALPFWHIQCYSVSIGDEDGVTACANAMGGTVAAPNDPISACIQDWTNCDATCGFKDWATDTMMGGGQPLYNSEQQTHPVQGELIGNVLQGVDVAAGNFLPACNANVNGVAGMCDPTVNASTLTNFTNNGCCVADSCVPSTTLEGELAAQADIKMFPLYGPASVGGYISMCAGTHFLCNTDDDCPGENDEIYLTALNGYRATQKNWKSGDSLNGAAKNNMGTANGDGDVLSPDNYDSTEGCKTYFVYGPTEDPTGHDPMQFNDTTAKAIDATGWKGDADGFPGDVKMGTKHNTITAGFKLADDPVFEVSVNELAARSGANMTSADLPVFAHNPLLNGGDQDVVVQPWDYSDINRSLVWEYVNNGFARELAGASTNNSIDTSTQDNSFGPTWWTGQRNIENDYGSPGQSCVPLGAFQTYTSNGSTGTRFGGGNSGVNPSIFWKDATNATFLHTDQNGAVACIPAVTGADGRPLYSLMAPPIHLRSSGQTQESDQKGALAQGVATTIYKDDTGQNYCNTDKYTQFEDPLTGIYMNPCSKPSTGKNSCSENFGFCSARSYMYQYYDGGAGKPMALYQGGMMTEHDNEKFIYKNNDSDEAPGVNKGAAGSTMESKKSTNPEQWNYCTQNSDCYIPDKQLQALFGDREIPWWYDLRAANKDNILCIGGAQDEFYQNLQSTGNYSKYVNPIGGQRLTSANHTGSSDNNSQNAVVQDGANLVDFTTGVAGMCYIANPTGKSKSDPTCFSGGTVPCWGFQPPEVTSGTSSVPYCGAVRPFTDTSVNTNFIFDVDAPCATFSGGNGEGDAVFCDTTKSGQHCTRGVTDNVWWANDATWADNDTALMTSIGCTLSIEDKAFVSKMANWGTTWTPQGYEGPLTNRQWASPIDSSGTGVNLSVGPFDLQSDTVPGPGGVTTFVTVPPTCALGTTTGAIPMGAPTLDPQFNCPARQNCYVASTPGSSATAEANLNLEGYEYHSALAAAGISGKDVNNAEAPPIVLYGASGAVSNIVSNQYTTQNCVHDSILNVCSNGGLADLYLNPNDIDSSSTKVPEDANILEGGASWPHVLYHDVQASGVGTTEASGLTFVELCSADPCFSGANDNQGLCQSTAAGAVAAERGYCVTEPVCSAWGGTWDASESRGCVTYRNQGPLAKADNLNVLWTQVGDGTGVDAADGDPSADADEEILYRKLCAKTHGVYQYGSDSSGGGACVYPSCTTTARTTLSRLAQSSELMIFGLEEPPTEQTFFLRSPNQSTADTKYKMLVIPGQMAWVPACGGNCNVYGNSTADLTNLGAWSTPSFITMYTGGISDTQQGYKPIVKNSTTTNYQWDFVFAVILWIFGVMFIGAGVLLLQKQRKRATDNADPGAAAKELSSSLTGAASAVVNVGKEGVDVVGKGVNVLGKGVNDVGEVVDSGVGIVTTGINDVTKAAGRKPSD